MKMKTKKKSGAKTVWFWSKHWEYHFPHFSLGCGSFLLAVGLLWLAQELGLLPAVPLWPLVLILLGVWIIAGTIAK